jgi:hypothetical protein
MHVCLRVVRPSSVPCKAWLSLSVLLVDSSVRRDRSIGSWLSLVVLVSCRFRHSFNKLMKNGKVCSIILFSIYHHYQRVDMSRSTSGEKWSCMCKCASWRGCAWDTKRHVVGILKFRGVAIVVLCPHCACSVAGKFRQTSLYSSGNKVPGHVVLYRRPLTGTLPTCSRGVGGNRRWLKRGGPMIAGDVIQYSGSDGFSDSPAVQNPSCGLPPSRRSSGRSNINVRYLVVWSMFHNRRNPVYIGFLYMYHVYELIKFMKNIYIFF